MRRTAFEGFPVQYGEHLTASLNACYNQLRGKIDYYALKEVSNAIAYDSICRRRGTTQDGYEWFCHLEFYLPGGGRVVVLFPWAQDWSDPVSWLDRSISVHSTRPLPTTMVEGLLEKITHTMVEQAVRTKQFFAGETL